MTPNPALKADLRENLRTSAFLRQLLRLGVDLSHPNNPPSFCSLSFLFANRHLFLVVFFLPPNLKN